jgi:hypothetical protein
MPTLSTFLYLIYKGVNLGTIVNLDNLSGLKNGNSIGTYLAAAFSTLSSFLVVYALVQQNLDRKKNEAKDHFFKMVDYHNDTLKQISVPSLEIEKTHIEEGRRAFVPFKIQIKRLLELVKNSSMSNNFLLTENEIIDVAYMIFFYGLDRKWKGFIVEKLKIYPNHLALVDDIIIKIEDNPKLHLGRTNQTFLGVYFRNMYNAIKLVDSNNYLSNAEKKDLIKIYRAQISNPEFYVLFFNVTSRFGKNWKKNKYITKYEFIRNIPKGYLDGYEPNDYFPMAYEHEE